MALDSVPPEHRALLHPKLTEDAGHAQVVWARVRGYPSWPVSSMRGESATCWGVGRCQGWAHGRVPVRAHGRIEHRRAGRPACVQRSSAKTQQSTESICAVRMPLCRGSQAQVLSEAAARKKLGKVPHRRDMDVPVMFFGTLEIAWIGKADIVPFADGIKKGFLGKGKQKNFQKALEQVGMPGRAAFKGPQQAIMSRRMARGL